MNPGKYLSALWRGSIRRQLVLSFALSSLALMSGFGYLIFEQQRVALYQASEERATSLAHALSISGTSWAMANDLAGLQEVVQGFANTPDLRRAFFLNPHGEVLASTNQSEVGFFLTDAVSRNMLASTAADSVVLMEQRNLIVVAHPVLADGARLGWVRVEMSRDTANANLSSLASVVFGFVLLSVLAVSLVAFALAHRLTLGLHHLMRVTATVEQGGEKPRADVGRKDEIGVLARHLDRMLDTLGRQKNVIEESEANYRFLAENISDVIWIVNLDTNRWVYISPPVEKLLGYTVAQIKAQPTDYLLSPLSQADIKERIVERVKVFRSGEDGDHVYTDEVQQRRSDGSMVWTEVTTRIARDVQGKMILLGVTRDIDERMKADEQIRNLAFYDPLTQLPNRRLLMDRFGLVISACKRNHRYAALMFIDLDNFKPLNDEHGHDMGDILLADVAQRIAGCVREVDTVARFGGDEFVVILSELDADKNISKTQAMGVADKIRRMLGEPYRLSASHEGAEKPCLVEHRCTASIGVVLFNSRDNSPDDLLRLADNAMYRAKMSGRNRVHFAETSQ
ncbi:MAG: diguanylate cyclase [Sideroxydans sp.]|nr:diguanylate cyclase [Sideroxydans sp.]